MGRDVITTLDYHILNPGQSFEKEEPLFRYDMNQLPWWVARRYESSRARCTPPVKPYYSTRATSCDGPEPACLPSKDHHRLLPPNKQSWASFEGPRSHEEAASSLLPYSPTPQESLVVNENFTPLARSIIILLPRIKKLAPGRSNTRRAGEASS